MERLRIALAALADLFRRQRFGGSVLIGLRFRDAMDHRAGRLGVLLAYRADPVGQRARGGAIRAVAGEQSVQHHAERVDIGSGGDGLAAELFGAGVIGREGALAGERGLRGDAHRSGVEQFGDAEIEQHGRAFAGHQDIGGF